MKKAQRTTRVIYAFANREARRTKKGYRLWETTTEGSPISPYFRTMEELYRWAADNATIFADKQLSADEWQSALTGDTPATVRLIS